MANLTVRGSDGQTVVAIVDDEDGFRLARYPWVLLPPGYVARRERRNGRLRVHYLHREVVGATHGDSLRVEHVSGNKLDNRRANLRVRPTMPGPAKHRRTSSTRARVG